MQGSPNPGNRPKGDPDRELGSRNQVSMGPTSKTPLTQRGSEGQGSASIQHSTPSSAVDLDIVTTGSDTGGGLASPDGADRFPEYRPPEDLTSADPNRRRTRSAMVRGHGTGLSTADFPADIASMDSVLEGARAQSHGLIGQRTGLSSASHWTSEGPAVRAASIMGQVDDNNRAGLDTGLGLLVEPMGSGFDTGLGLSVGTNGRRGSCGQKRRKPGCHNNCQTSGMPIRGLLWDERPTGTQVVSEPERDSRVAALLATGQAKAGQGCSIHTRDRVTKHSEGSQQPSPWETSREGGARSRRFLGDTGRHLPGSLWRPRLAAAGWKGCAWETYRLTSWKPWNGRRKK